MSIAEDIEKHKHASKSSPKLKPRRLSVPVTVNLQKVIDAFKSNYPGIDYKDTAVLSTFIEAGAKVWAAHQRAKKAQAEVESE